MKKLRNNIIALTGDFGEARSYAKIRQWIEAQGGRMVTQISDEVTHLVASKKNFEASVEMVQQAQAIPKLKIVTFDWLEISLMERTAMPVKAYLHKITQEQKQKQRVAQKEIRKARRHLSNLKYESNYADFTARLGHDGYHIYVQDGLVHDIIIARTDPSNNSNERYNIKVFKSDLIPTRWAVYVTYSSSTSSFTRLLAPSRSTWYEARDAWHNFFLQHTGKAWDNRNDGRASTDPQAFRYLRTKSELEYERFWRESQARAAELTAVEREEHNSQVLAMVYEEEAKDRAARQTKATEAKAAALTESFPLLGSGDTATTANAEAEASPESSSTTSEVGTTEFDEAHTDAESTKYSSMSSCAEE